MAILKRRKPLEGGKFIEESNTRVIQGNCYIDRDMEFKENLVVLGSITCKDRLCNLKVLGNFAAEDIFLGNLDVEGDTRVRYMDVRGDMKGRNLSAVRNIAVDHLCLSGSVSAENILSGSGIKVKGDISARSVYSATSIIAGDMMVQGQVMATDCIKVRNADVGSIHTEGDVYYYEILVWHERKNGLVYRRIFPTHENAKHYWSKKPVNIKCGIYVEKDTLKRDI